jgi:hypothetical protein
MNLRILHVKGIYIYVFRWALGQPDNLGGKQNCLIVSVSNTTYAFKDENCESKFRYICETFDTVSTPPSTGGKQVQKECATTFGINESKFNAKFTKAKSAHTPFQP